MNMEFSTTFDDRPVDISVNVNITPAEPDVGIMSEGYEIHSFEVFDSETGTKLTYNEFDLERLERVIDEKLQSMPVEDYDG